MARAIDPLHARCKRAFAVQRHRARRDGVTLAYTALDLLAIARASALCAYCRNLVPVDQLSFDHATPVSRGGRHALDNLAAVCQRCNRAKGKLTFAEFLALLVLLRGWHPAARQDVERRLLQGAVRYRRR